MLLACSFVAVLALAFVIIVAATGVLVAAAVRKVSGPFSIFQAHNL